MFSSSRVLFLAALLVTVRALDAEVPSVTLPWGTWQANKVDPVSNLIAFENLRFGKPPNGTLRFQRPFYPDKIPSPEKAIMDNTYGPTCHQVDTHPSCQVPKPTIPASEDCLFLDVHVPQSVWDKRGTDKVPVVVWFYGGAYEFGAKSAFGTNLPFYTGDGVLNAATKIGEDFIFVASNYRLGAFGWMSGPTMEKQGRTNAGIYDQRLALQWVQDFIYLFGGDKGQVSAWGESAGAGSILHHLMADGGKRDPLFQRVFVQSPAFQWQWDRSSGGTLEQVYRNFTKEAGCDGSFDCIVKADEATLVKANQALWDQFSLIGLFQLGPALDADTFPELSATAYDKGHVWSGLKSLAVSHVTHEADSFTPGWVKTENDFDYFMKLFIREARLEPVRQKIKDHYPASDYENPNERLKAIIGDSSFYCNARDMFNAYHTKIPVYMMLYDFARTFARHATDLMPTFWTSTFDVSKFLETYVCGIDYVKYYTAAMMQLAPSYQEYLADLAVSGNPAAHPREQQWKPAMLTNNGNTVQAFRVQALPFFDPDSPDPQTNQDTCSFWTQIAADIVKYGDRSSDSSDHAGAAIADDNRQETTFKVEL